MEPAEEQAKEESVPAPAPAHSLSLVDSCGGAAVLDAAIAKA